MTGLLVRTPQSEWRKGSVIAVDAGTHLASIVRILAEHMPLYSKDIPPAGYSQVIKDGPFEGVKCPGISARANALYIFRELMHAFLITHPHLDHISAMGINTPALEYGREAKTIIALDSTIEAIKSHIFNDSIWPNLSDEGSGVGFVTYRRLREGGNNRLGSGDQRGYVRVCENIATLCMGVTHGKCKAKPASPRHLRSESSGWPEAYAFPSARRLSRISDHESYFAAKHSHELAHNSSSSSLAHIPPGPATPGYSAMHTPALASLDADHFEPVKSSAFFILNEETASEILIFGDIEPDEVSSSPQNYKVWRTAASKVAGGTLKAMFIECSYDDAVRDSDLYGHLCPRHLIQELLFLAKEVAEAKGARVPSTIPSSTRQHADSSSSVSEATYKNKRKRPNGSGDFDIPQSPQTSTVAGYVGTRSFAGRRKTSQAVVDTSPPTLRAQSPSRMPQSAKHVHFSGSSGVQATSPTMAHPHLSLNSALQSQTPIDGYSTGNGHMGRPHDSLKGLTIYIIHVKDTLMDGPSPGEIIIEQLREQAVAAGLECDFHVTDFGESIWV